MLLRMNILLKVAPVIIPFLAFLLVEQNFYPLLLKQSPNPAFILDVLPVLSENVDLQKTENVDSFPLIAAHSMSQYFFQTFFERDEKVKVFTSHV